LAIPSQKRKIRARRITGQERDTKTQQVLRKARTDAHQIGAREKRAKDKAAESAGKAKKAGGDEAAAEE